jgi:phospholipid transport system transporter-binding protein
MAAFPADINLQTAPQALIEARAALSVQGRVLDLSPLVRFDSAALGVLLALRREAGSSLAFSGVPANLRTLAGLYGVDALLFADPS